MDAAARGAAAPRPRRDARTAGEGRRRAGPRRSPVPSSGGASIRGSSCGCWCPRSRSSPSRSGCSTPPSYEAFVAPLAWAFGALLAASLGVAAAARARRSPVLAVGLAGALAAAGLLLWPVTRVTLGRAPCPPRAGPDLGAPVAAAALEAWRGGVTGDTGWRAGRADPAWTARARAAGLLDFSLVETGCWERVAPVDGSRTWHEFRATVRAGEDNPLSKIVVVHTARGDAGWKITAIEGPLP